MTPHRFFTAVLMFHVFALGLVLWYTRAWRRRQARQAGVSVSTGVLVAELFGLAVLVYLASLLASLVPNLDWGSRVHVGPISLTLLGQALFFEGALLAGALGVMDRGRRPRRALASIAVAFLLAAVHVDAYYIEPRMIVPRLYEVGPVSANDTIRILHLSDLQTPSIGPREERALRQGLAYKPDLIVMTGDYVQDALGTATEERAAQDLRALIERIGFRAPLGTFATEGDVGPECADVFAGTSVRCLRDRSAVVTLPSGATLAITGLSRSGGRMRDTARLERLLNAAAPADFEMVISHAPDFVDSLPRPLTLALAGHTHGGQVVLPLFGPPKTAIRLPRRYAGGLNLYGETPLQVSRGLGMERGFTIPIRFLCPPEFSIIDLRLGRRLETRNEPPPGRARS
jgi:predicted MPP superfamily phosphohydrolase